MTAKTRTEAFLTIEEYSLESWAVLECIKLANWDALLAAARANVCYSFRYFGFFLLYSRNRFSLNNITVAFIRMVMGFPALVAEIKFTVTTAYQSRP
jgi:hypothetical protein